MALALAELSDPRRAAVVAEAKSWIGTRYIHQQRVKGPAGGVDCLTFVCEVFERAGIVPHVEIPFYPVDWHLHRDIERYMQGVLQYAMEIPPPPLPGDIVLFRIGRCYAHGAIVSNWPRVIHAWNGAGVLEFDTRQPLMADRRGKLPEMKWFSPFGGGLSARG